MSHKWFYDPSFMWHRRRHRHGKNVYTLFEINGTKVLLKPNENIFMLTDVPFLGPGLDMAVSFIEETGRPADPFEVADIPPRWISASTTTDLSVSKDGLTAHARPVEIGRDTISVEVFVGRTMYAASVIANVVGVKMRLTSVKLVAMPTP